MSLINKKTGLVKYDQMGQAIVAATSIDEVLTVHDQSKAAQYYAHIAKNEEAEAKIAAYRIRAVHKLGVLLKEMEAKR